MVRRLVYAQVAAAQGRCPTENLTELLERGARPGAAGRVRIPAGLAPAPGLTLVEVLY
jgi:hypothetical protein